MFTGMTRRKIMAALALSPLAGGAAGAASAWASSSPRSSGGCRPGGGRQSARELFRRTRLHNVELTTHEGRKVRFYDDLVKDRKVLINMMYVNCEGICVPAIRNLVGVQKLLNGRVGRDIFFYSITLKPEEDTPEVLREYAKAHGVGPGWQFLTGHPAEIEALRRGLGFTFSDPEEDADVSNHLGHVRLIVEPAARWGHSIGMSPPEHILRSINFTLDSPTVRNVPTYAVG